MSSSYTPTVWADGDTITAAKMNKLESGVANAIADAAEASAGAGAGGVLVVDITLTESGFIMNKTAGEIMEAVSGGIAFVRQIDGFATNFGLIETTDYTDELGYYFRANDLEYFAATLDDYPENGGE